MNKLSLSAIIAGTIISYTTSSQAGLFDRPDFFERGDEQFEQEVERFEQPTPEPSLSIEGKEQTWQHLVSREGGFSLWIPCGVMTDETKVLETDAGDLKFEVLATNPQSSRFVIAYSQELTSAQLDNREEILVRLRDRIVENTNFKLINESSIFFDDYPGKQLHLQNSGETIIFKVYLIDRRIYLLGASQSEGDESKQAIAFFDSFKLL